MEEDNYNNIPPYNNLVDGVWTTLWQKRHPLCHLINFRFSDNYNGKLTWRELTDMKKRIDEVRLSINTYRDEEYYPRRKVLFKLIRDQEALCGVECAEKLSKHLKECKGDGSGKYTCSKNWICFYCQFKKNGRCSHYDEIERANEELEEKEYYYEEDTDKLDRMMLRYNRMLAIKENRLEDYEDDYY